jgi:hypothetical protein
MRPTVLALVLCCGSLAGCGGVFHMSRSLSAKRAVERARTANAQDKAPYHLALAEAYLAQAEIEMTGAHGQEALAYDDLALDHALKAETLARGGKLEPAAGEAEGAAPPAEPESAAKPAKPAKGTKAPAKKKTSSEDEDL